MRLNSATLSLPPSLQVNSHAAEAKGRDAEKESGNKRVVEGGRGCEKVIEKQQLREKLSVCVSTPERASARETEHREAEQQIMTVQG